MSGITKGLFGFPGIFFVYSTLKAEIFLASPLQKERCDALVNSQNRVEMRLNFVRVIINKIVIIISVAVGPLLQVSNRIFVLSMV